MTNINNIHHEKLITIGSYSNISEAYIFKNILDLEGIETFVDDSNAFFTPSVPDPHDGGVRLSVRDSDAARAVIALNQAKQEANNNNEF
jgi:hypothetical protein